MTVKAIYEDGVLKPREPLPLKEHEEVEIEVRRPSDRPVGDPQGWRVVEDLIGFIDDAPSDMAENHDEYLYGRRPR